MNSWEKIIDQILILPQNQQHQALLNVRRNLKIHIKEEWNSEFGQESLYEAWSLTEPMQNIYNKNRTIIREFLNNKKNWIIVEAGGGNGSLWRDFFQVNQSVF